MHKYRDTISKKYVSKYDISVQNECVGEYQIGISKKELSDKYNVSIRTIDRWVKKWGDASKNIRTRIGKRANKIPVKIQEELMMILNKNAILYGFYTSVWNKDYLVKFIKKEFNLDITKYMAEQLIQDSKRYILKKDEIIDEIEELERNMYKLCILDFIRIGKISRNEIEPYTNNMIFTKSTIDVNLAIARLENRVYLDIIFSQISIKKNTHKNIFKQEIEDDIKNIISDKSRVIKKILEKEHDKIAFITLKDGVTKRFNKSSKGAVFYIVEENEHKQLIQDKYEFDELSIVQYLERENNSYRNFQSLAKIYRFLQTMYGNYKKYILNDREKISNCMKNVDISIISEYF